MAKKSIPPLRKYLTAALFGKAGVPIAKAYEFIGGGGRTKLYSEIAKGNLEAKKLGDLTILTVWSLVEYVDNLPDYKPTAAEIESAVKSSCDSSDED